MLGELSGASEADSSYGGIKRLQEYPRVVPQMEKDLSSKSAVRARTDNGSWFTVPFTITFPSLGDELMSERKGVGNGGEEAGVFPVKG